MNRKIAVLGLAGCLTLVGTTGAFAQQGNVAELSMVEQQPTTEAIQQLAPLTITSEKIVAHSEIVNIEIEYPVISGLEDEAFQIKLNNEIKEHVLKQKENIEKEAAEYAELAKQENWEIRPYELIIDYSVKNKERVLSFTISSYTYTGGAHGDEHTVYYNIDLKHNRVLSLADLFQKDSNYQEIINAEIKKQMAEKVAAGEGMYFGMDGESSIEGFKSIAEDQAFYLADGHLVIAFGKYEIAPGVMGEPTFEIPLAELKSLLKEEYHTLLASTGETDEEVDNSTVNQAHKLSLPTADTYENEQGITMIPLRAVAEGLGYTLEWNASERAVEITRLPHWTVVREGQDSYFFARMAPFSLGAAPEINADGIMYVPLAFATKVLQAEVNIVDSVIKINN